MSPTSNKASDLYRRYAPHIMVALVALASLYGVARHNYLLYHTLAETFSIVIAGGIFFVAWHTRAYSNNSYLVFLGIIYLCVGTIDYFHTISYKGMGILGGGGSNTATQLWIVARYLEATALLIAPVFVRRRFRPHPVLVCSLALTVLFLFAVIRRGMFPDCYIEGEGLTRFKRISEIIVVTLLIAAALHLRRRRGSFDPGVYRLLIASIGLTIASELFFSMYTDVYGLYNFAGHAAKIVSFYFIYRAVVAASLEKPHATLYRDLHESESSLRKIKAELEQRVQERTAQLRQSNRRLEHEVDERRRSERRLALITETINDVVWMSTPDFGRMLYVSPAYESVWGSSVESLYEDPGSFLEAVDGEDRSWVGDQLRNHGRQRWRMEYRLVGEDGKVRWVRHKTFPVSEEGRVSAVVSMISDITALEQARRLLAETNEELERKVHERTRELEQANRNLHEEIAGRREMEMLSEELGRISVGLLAQRDPDSLLERTLSPAARALGAETAGVALKDSEAAGWDARFGVGLPDEAFGVSFTDKDLPHAALAVSKHRAVAVNDVRTDRRVNPDVAATFGLRSVLVVPFKTRRDTCGVFFFNHHAEIHAWSAAQIDFADKLAVSVSFAMENAQLFAELQEIGEELKQRVERQRESLSRTEDSLVDTEQQLTDRQQALEAVYAMATAFTASPDLLYDQIALSIAHILKVSSAAVITLRDAEMIDIKSYVLDGKLLHARDEPFTCRLGKDALESARPLTSRCVLQPGEQPNCCLEEGMCSRMSVPMVASTDDVLGVICIMDRGERTFAEYEIHLVEIFARYVAHEIQRQRLEGRLRQSEQLELLGRLTSGVAHEVRNPLNAIQAILEALFDELKETGEFDSYLIHLRSQLNRLGELMEDLLSLGRPVRREDMEQIPVPELLSASVASWSDSRPAEAGDVRMEIAPECQTWTIRGAPVKLQQVVVNLLQNASQHSPDGAPIELSASQGAGGEAVIAVADHGRGINDGDGEKVFEAFYTTRKGGTGLGLSIVRHIVEHHGGRVSLRPREPGPGTVAEVVLPFFKVGEEADDAAGG